MPSSFGQYQSGIQPVQGISEAGANIGRTYMAGMGALSQGITNLGNTLADGIKQYASLQQERDLYTGKIGAFANQANQMLAYAKQNPENAGFVNAKSAQIADLLQQSQDAPNMSLGKLRALATQAELTSNSLDNEFKMFNLVKTQNEERAAIEALNPSNVSPTQTKDEAIKISLGNYDFSKSLSSQRNAFLTQLQQMKAQNPNANWDIADALKQWDTGLSNTADEISKTNPIGLQLKDQIKNLEFINKASSPDVEGYTSAEESIATPISQQNVNVSGIADELSKQKAELERLNKLKESGDYIPQNLLEKGLQVASDLGTPVSDALKQRLAMQVAGAYKASGQIITPELADKISSMVSKGGFGSELAGLLSYGKYALLANPLTTIPTALTMAGTSQLPDLKQKDIDLVQSALNKNIQQAKSGGAVYGTAGLANKDINRQIAETESNIKSLEGQAQAEQATAQPTSFQTPIMGTINEQGVQKVTAGTKQVEEPIPQQELAQKRYDFMAQRLGYKDANGNTVIPASAYSLLGRLNSQPRITMLPNGGQIVEYTDSTGKVSTHIVEGIKPTYGELKAEKESRFGGVSPETGQAVYERPIPKLDVMLYGQGNFTTQNEARDFRLMLGKYSDTIDAMNEVKQLLHDHPAAVKNPASIPYQQIIQKQAKAISLMKETLGFDRLSDKKLEIIMDRIPKGESWMKTPSQGIIAADGVIKDLYQSIKTTAEASKLKAIVPSDAKDTTLNTLRQKNLQAQRGIQPQY